MTFLLRSDVIRGFTKQTTQICAKFEAYTSQTRLSNSSQACIHSFLSIDFLISATIPQTHCARRLLLEKARDKSQAEVGVTQTISGRC